MPGDGEPATDPALGVASSARLRSASGGSARVGVYHLRARNTDLESKTWRELLAGRTREDWQQELDTYESQLALKREGRLDDKVFAETRLRRGAYGQRYDNGMRHDGS